MSGGKFDYKENDLCNELFGWHVDTIYGFGEAKHYYKDPDHYSICRKLEYESYRESVLATDPLDDKILSELVYDVLNLIHSKDCCDSGDTGEDQYKDDKKAFKDKWLKGIKKTHVKEIIEISLEDMKRDLFNTFDIGDEDDVKYYKRTGEECND